MGWIVVMFDLPVITDAQRKEASGFRNQLRDSGYMMIQFSVYARPCPSFEHMERESVELQRFIPEGGNIRILFITDHQWEEAITVIGDDYAKKHHQKSPEMPNQLEFW